MAVCLVFCRLKKFAVVVRVRCRNRARRHNPNANAFHSPCINIARVFQSHCCITCVKASAMAVFESVFRPDKYFPEWPVFHFFRIRVNAQGHLEAWTIYIVSNFNSCFSAYAIAASRTHLPLSQALRRASILALLHGPWPLTTCQNSSQSISP
jgi:transposase InsO family protein